MTQHHKSADKKFYSGGTSKRLASSLSAQGLCLLSSFSLLGSGFVTAQTEISSIDNIVPTIENSQPTAVANPVQKETIVPEIAKPQPDFAARQANLKKRLNSKSVSKAENTQQLASVRISKPKAENTQQPASVSKIDSVIKKLPEVPQANNNSQDIARDTENKPKDYNNAYIDTNEYRTGDSGNYQAPSSVVVTERSSDCAANMSTGQAGCAKAKQTPTVAKSKESAPTWLKKSEIAKLTPVSGQKKLGWKTIPANSTPTENITQNVAETVASNVSKISQPQNNWRISRTNTNSHTKAEYHANRFIPSPGEFSATKVSSTPVASQVGSLAAPMMEGNVAPRPSMVSYDFALASVLPQVPYTNTIAYRGTVGGGMIFPLAAAAPITSLFGWRVHPITGDRRFHAGTDLGAPTGTPILAAARGQVESANWLGGYGLAVTINHGSAQQSLYGHMSEIFVQPGQWVEPGTVIGRVGSTGNSTGPHLHFEIRHLTQEGWVAVDPGVQLEGGISQLAQSTQGTKTAQAQ
ncbi:MAG: M23 family metallopeptidase [Nostocales cyanobacterium ELA583]|jgi:murein DD-endopeptidase MepM/ murein hydrolase activator NlpD